MPAFDFHIFVCSNSREAGHARGSCDPEKQGKLLAALKTAVAKVDSEAVVRVNKAGCMNQCEHGAVVVVYPEGTWYGGVTEADAAELVCSHLVEGHPLERLRLAPECLNTATCVHRRDTAKECK